MRWDGWRGLLLLVAVVVASAGACSGLGDDVARGAGQAGRLVVRNADDLGRTASTWDDLAAAARNGSDDAGRLLGRVDDVPVPPPVGTAPVPSRYQDAVNAVVADTACDVVLGELPADRDSLRPWLVDKLLTAGLAAADEEVLDVLVGDVVALVDEPGERQAAYDVCEAIANAGY